MIQFGIRHRLIEVVTDATSFESYSGLGDVDIGRQDDRMIGWQDERKTGGSYRMIRSC